MVKIYTLLSHLIEVHDGYARHGVNEAVESLTTIVLNAGVANTPYEVRHEVQQQALWLTSQTCTAIDITISVAESPKTLELCESWLMKIFLEFAEALDRSGVGFGHVHYFGISLVVGGNEVRCSYDRIEQTLSGPFVDTCLAEKIAALNS